MASENFERQMEFILAQQAQSAARMKEIEDIIVLLARGTRDRFHGNDERVDDVNEKISALVDSQIRSQARVDSLDQQHAARFDGIDEKIAALVNGDLRAQERGREIDKKIAALVESQGQAEERGREIDKKIAALVESQVRTEESVKETQENFKNTDEAVRSLANVVDRYISRRRNGDSNDKP